MDLVNLAQSEQFVPVEAPESLILCFIYWQLAVNIFLIMLQRYRESLKVSSLHALSGHLLSPKFYNLWNSIGYLITRGQHAVSHLGSWSF